jgi:Ca2+-binding RTX toxin-like protein
MIGGTGNDRYLVSVLGDSTVELAGEGIDEVQTSLATYALQANIENLTFSAGNVPHAAGVGNALDNVITGASAYDELYGLAGNDTLRGGSTVANTLLGGAGDDLYVATAVGDSIIELAGEGTDTVQTNSTTFTLRANVENLTYTGTLLFTGIGNAEANSITGGAAADFLSGLDGADILTGGSGADTLLGGAGADQFRYTGTETGVDRILDFAAGSDQIALSNTGYTHTTITGFIQGPNAVATEAVSTFLYDTVTGMVSLDADGNGAGAAVQIAQLNAGLSLSVTDFVFYG